MVIDEFAETIKVATYLSGQRRTIQDPPTSVLQRAFDELGTHSAVAEAFGVSRRVVRRWLAKYTMNVASRPEVRLARDIRQRLSRVEDQDRIAQWLMDEGSISVCYYGPSDITQLLVCGSMNDYSVLSQISKILGAPITSSRAPQATTLPMGAVRVQSARAYALLELLRPRLVGLKALEATAALSFFTPPGRVKGRHTTDEFLASVWRAYAINTLLEWNLRRRMKIGPGEINVRAKTWVEGRIKRARRFLESPSNPKELTAGTSAPA